MLRDNVQLILLFGEHHDPSRGEKGRVFPKRLLDSLLKLPRLRRAETVVFTSSVYRRDHGRNLAAEYLMERYPNAVVFEWPARNEAFDGAYFSDPQRERYCPLDIYPVLYKLARLLRRKRLREKAEQIRIELRRQFEDAPDPRNENEAAAIRYLLEALPESAVTTELSQAIFQKLFRRYRSIQYAIDFWGSGRENIFPVLPGEPEKIELQHGLINSTHPGYIYPDFVRDLDTDFFRRTLLVYGEATKQLLCKRSIFRPEQIEVIGNPRIQMYRREFPVKETERNLILFTSQPFEQDGSGVGYYDTMIPILGKLQEMAVDMGLELCIKLHPRENTEIAEKYKKRLSDVSVMGNDASLYDLLQKSWLHITVSSTTLFEAAFFRVPTVVISYREKMPEESYGFTVKTINRTEEIGSIFDEVRNNYSFYLEYLVHQTEIQL